MSLKFAKRKAVNLSPESLVQVGDFQTGTCLNTLVQPAVAGVNLIEWATEQRSWIESQLLQHGGILFRGFPVREATEFEQFLKAVSGELLEYTYRSTPRSQVQGNIYTSTEYPAEQSIPLHNELSYTRSWPLKIGFFCVQPAVQNGRTPIADSRKVLTRLDAKLRQRFAATGVMYLRNYREGLDLPWQTVFQTEDRAAVEHYCRQAGIEWEWVSPQHLRTRQVCQAIATHPQTGERVWFNQAHLFHVSSLPQVVRESLLATLPEIDLPRNTYYGDGSPIESEVLAEIHQALAAETLSFPWQAGDILLLDNMLTAHGRTPFVGPRRVLTGMTELFTPETQEADK